MVTRVTEQVRFGHALLVERVWNQSGFLGAGSRLAKVTAVQVDLLSFVLCSFVRRATNVRVTVPPQNHCH